LEVGSVGEVVGVHVDSADDVVGVAFCAVPSISSLRGIFESFDVSFLVVDFDFAAVGGFEPFVVAVARQGTVEFGFECEANVMGFEFDVRTVVPIDHTGVAFGKEGAQGGVECGGLVSELV
jgi:hypothetical protein